MAWLSVVRTVQGAFLWVLSAKHQGVQVMQDSENRDIVSLEARITERFGVLLTQAQLAELLGRTPRGLRYSLSYPSDANTSALKSCGRRIGRRVYYPAQEVALIIAAANDA